MSQPGHEAPKTCTAAMAQRNFTPVNQIRLTNVAIVKYKKGTAYSPWLGKRPIRV